MRRPPYSPGTAHDSNQNKHTRAIVRTCNGTELRDFSTQVGGSDIIGIQFAFNLTNFLLKDISNLNNFVINRLTNAIEFYDALSKKIKL